MTFDQMINLSLQLCLISEYTVDHTQIKSVTTVQGYNNVKEDSSILQPEPYFIQSFRLYNYPNSIFFFFLKMTPTLGSVTRTVLFDYTRLNNSGLISNFSSQLTTLNILLEMSGNMEKIPTYVYITI